MALAIDKLMELGADINHPSLRPDTVTNAREVPLAYAINDGSLQAYQRMRELGADPKLLVKPHGFYTSIAHMLNDSMDDSLQKDENQQLCFEVLEDACNVGESPRDEFALMQVEQTEKMPLTLPRTSLTPQKTSSLLLWMAGIRSLPTPKNTTIPKH